MTAAYWWEQGWCDGTELRELGVTLHDASPPLSGEMSGRSIPEIFGSWDAATDEAMHEYEQGYWAALDNVIADPDWTGEDDNLQAMAIERETE